MVWEFKKEYKVIEVLDYGDNEINIKGKCMVWKKNQIHHMEMQSLVNLSKWHLEDISDTMKEIMRNQ